MQIILKQRCSQLVIKLFVIYILRLKEALYGHVRMMLDHNVYTSGEELGQNLSSILR